MMRLVTLLPLAFAAAACTPVDQAPPDAATPPSGAQCDATDVRALLGRMADAATVEEARTRAGARTVRQYVTGSALTMDFRPDRLNIETASDGTIVKVSCG
ncbi:I78 family peptidase inhibitor [Sphingomonas baiyangensis]|uniref:Peptidase inhibitor I78 family protein n=1 Tax=Sphingomonas baiyangensis TaxID=2572576 RepID=A0A4U1L8Y5_9SPHN|nr:I78 family peptidase inhibitor [Sphingomonas baiyangensis]TKD52855.1 hypothetical protein FBR43_00400 [Sphingomonas baiyangensis]